MTEAEARAIMQEKGWTYTARPRSSLKTKYVYAQRRQGLDLVDRYICPLSQLENLTEAQLKAKLDRLPANGQPTSAEET